MAKVVSPFCFIPEVVQKLLIFIDHSVCFLTTIKPKFESNNDGVCCSWHNEHLVIF